MLQLTRATSQETDIVPVFEEVQVLTGSRHTPTREDLLHKTLAYSTNDYCPDASTGPLTSDKYLNIFITTYGQLLMV